MDTLICLGELTEIWVITASKFICGMLEFNRFFLPAVEHEDAVRQELTGQLSGTSAEGLLLYLHSIEVKLDSV